MYTFPCLHRNCHSGIEKGQNRKCLGCVQHELHRNTVHGKFPLVESPLSYSELSSIDSDWWKRMQVITVHLINRIKTSTSLGQVKVNMARLHLGARFGLRTYKMPDPCILSQFIYLFLSQIMEGNWKGNLKRCYETGNDVCTTCYGNYTLING